MSHAALALVPAVVTPVDWGTLLQPVSDGAVAAITAALPIGIPVLVALVGLGIVFRVLGKFGVKR